MARLFVFFRCPCVSMRWILDGLISWAIQQRENGRGLHPSESSALILNVLEGKVRPFLWGLRDTAVMNILNDIWIFNPCGLFDIRDNLLVLLVAFSGIFPEADKDPVIQIASMVQRQGETEPFIRTVFTLQSCASIVGSQILCFTQENKLLQVTEDQEMNALLKF